MHGAYSGYRGALVSLWTLWDSLGFFGGQTGLGTAPAAGLCDHLETTRGQRTALTTPAGEQQHWVVRHAVYHFRTRKPLFINIRV